jgi:hypothetical protein
MINNPPLALTDHQMAELRAAVMLLRPSYRAEFLQAVAYKLGDQSQPTDAQLTEAIHSVLFIEPVWRRPTATKKETKHAQE